MSEFKNEWDQDMAMEVLKNPSVDSDLWSEAVTWLLLHGPEDIKEKLLEASGHATRNCYPELKPTGYTEEGTPCYNTAQLAETLGITEETVIEKIAELESEHERSYLLNPDEAIKLQ